MYRYMYSYLVHPLLPSLPPSLALEVYSQIVNELPLYQTIKEVLY